MPLRCLVLCTFAACVADASAPRRAPVARVVEPVPAPIAEAAPEPPPPPEPSPEPVAAPPPCPAHPRDRRQLPEHVIALAELAEAMTVVDLGSGDGYFLCWFSRAVGARGKVIATEVTKRLVRTLKRRVAREELANVEVVRAPANDVGVAPATADRIVLVNVWHHLPGRKRYAARIARALAPGGKLVVVDFPVRRHRGHGIAPARVLAELAAAGIDAEVVTDELADQYVIIGSVRPPG